MIYLNNAATSYPKPPQVAEAVMAALNMPPENQMRGTGGVVEPIADRLRRNMGCLMNIQATDRIFFCSGATDAANRIILGMTDRESDIIVSQTEHNSILRPLYNNPHTKDRITVAPCDLYGMVDIGKLTEKDNSIIFINHCSNVTGFIQNIQQICSEAHRHGSIVVVDASQSAGCIPIDVDGWGIDALIFTGHKSLLGPQGTGGWYMREGFPTAPAIYGGTGRDSSIITYIDDDREFEVGTQNIPGLCGLNAGVEYILNKSIDCIYDTEKQMTCELIASLNAISGVTVYSVGGSHQGPVVSFNVDGLSASDVGYILAQSYNITVRTGLHCSPLIHESLNTDRYGTVRVSLSCLNTYHDIESLINAVREIAGA